MNGMEYWEWVHLAVNDRPGSRQLVIATDEVMEGERRLIPLDLWGGCEGVRGGEGRANLSHFFLLPDLVVSCPALPLRHRRGFPLLYQRDSVALATTKRNKEKVMPTRTSHRTFILYSEYVHVVV